MTGAACRGKAPGPTTPGDHPRRRTLARRPKRPRAARPRAERGERLDWRAALAGHRASAHRIARRRRHRLRCARSFLCALRHIGDERADQRGVLRQCGHRRPQRARHSRRRRRELCGRAPRPRRHSCGGSGGPAWPARIWRGKRRASPRSRCRTRARRRHGGPRAGPRPFVHIPDRRSAAARRGVGALRPPRWRPPRQGRRRCGHWSDRRGDRRGGRRGGCRGGCKKNDHSGQSSGISRLARMPIKRLSGRPILTKSMNL